MLSVKRCRSTVKLVVVPAAVLLFGILGGCEREPAESLEVYLYGEGAEAAEAAGELAGGGEAALDVLLPAYEDPASRTRVGLVLAQMGEAAARRLVPLLTGGDAELAGDAAETLAAVGAPAVVVLAPNLRPTTTNVADVVFTLARIGDPAWQALLDAYEDYEDPEFRGLISAAFFLHGNEFLARRLLETRTPEELSADLLTTVALNLDPVELAAEVDLETAWRLLTFNPLEPLTLEISSFAAALPSELRRSLAEEALDRSTEEPFQSSLVLMHLSAVEGRWLDCADYGAEPFGTLVLRLEESLGDPQRSEVLAAALLHHGSLYLNYLIQGAESSADNLGLAAAAGEVARRLEPLVP